jgi:hypothetical protein
VFALINTTLGLLFHPQRLCIHSFIHPQRPAKILMSNLLLYLLHKIWKDFIRKVINSLNNQGQTKFGSHFCSAFLKEILWHVVVVTIVNPNPQKIVRTMRISIVKPPIFWWGPVWHLFFWVHNNENTLLKWNLRPTFRWCVQGPNS